MVLYPALSQKSLDTFKIVQIKEIYYENRSHNDLFDLVY